MIQRVQTLWMLLAAIAIFLTIKFSFYSGTLIMENVTNPATVLTPDGSYHVLTALDNFLILILTSALGTCIAVNIFLFKHRSIQMKLIIISILAELLIIYLYFRETKKFSQGSYSFTSVLHILIVVFLILAAKGIYNDSKLIKESNRLR
jgi:ethanolamine transporter EutH